MEFEYNNEEEVKVAFSPNDIEMIKKGLEKTLDTFKPVCTDTLRICKRVYEDDEWSKKAVVMPRVTFNVVERLIKLANG